MADTIKEYRIKIKVDDETHKKVEHVVKEFYKTLEAVIPKIMLDGEFYTQEFITKDPKNNHLFGLDSIAALEARVERQAAASF